MLLRDLLYKVNTTKLIGRTSIDIHNITFDSRKISDGDLFIAIKGEKVDGHDFICTAIDSGAKVIVVQQMPVSIKKGITYIKVVDSKKALAIISANFYNNPSEKIKLIGVTGTNGKTTIVNLLHQLFTRLNIKVGMLSTIENKINHLTIKATHTTPDSLQINFLLDKMVKSGCEYCFMEVSSHSVSQSRITALNFDAGVFTNITPDHLDYHKTFDQYVNAKKLFFDSLSSSAFCLVNDDDENASKMIENTKARKVSYSLMSPLSNYSCKILEKQFDGMLLNINNVDVWIKLTGEFNAYNILALFSICRELGFEENQLLTTLSLLENISGRFECNRFSDITTIVDYAHTENALDNVLKTINDIRSYNERLITVFGCGGDRDKSKRPLMSLVACKYSDTVIITSDNPRSEDPKSIINDMIKGLSFHHKRKVKVIVDRKEAIRAACELATKNDIVLVAGKGHEKFQEIQGAKIPFEDWNEIKQILNLNIK